MRQRVILLAILAVTVGLKSGGAATPNDNEFLNDLNQCGPVSLLVSMKLLGHDVSVADIEKVLPMDGRPKTLAEVDRAARQLGLSTLLLEWPEGITPEFVAPAIIRLKTQEKEDGHFVVCVRSPADKSTFLVYDYPSTAKPIRVPESAFVTGRFSDYWNRVALHITDFPNEIDRLKTKAESSSLVLAVRSLSTWAVVGLAVMVVLVSLIKSRSVQKTVDGNSGAETSAGKEMNL